MKKILSFVAAALMSVCLFAQTPSASDLASYQKEGYYVVCFSTPADATCNDIYWVGTYNDWSLASKEDMVQCEPLNGFEGWYVAVVPVGEENSGKPIQLSECGKLDWRYQCGLFGTIELVSGSVDIVAGAGGKGPNQDQNETDLKNWSVTEPTIITMTAWQENPCALECDEHRFTIRLYDPYCEENPDFEPYLRGTFNSWGDAVRMTLVDEEIDGEIVSVYTYTTDYITSIEFKWNNSADKDNWSNQFQEWIEPENEGEEGHWQDFSNFAFSAEQAAENNYVFEFDFSDITKYRYAQCGQEVVKYDETPYNVTVNVIFPEGMPEAGVEMTLNEETSVYTATAVMSAATLFKFREAGTWDNEIVVLKEDGSFGGFEGNEGNILVNDIIEGKYDFAQTEWTVAEEEPEEDPTSAEEVRARVAAEEGEGEGEGEEVTYENRVITLDFSDATKYAWKANVVETGLVNVEMLQNAGVRKVMIDGNLYIVRDGMLFNILGTQMK